MWRTFIATPVPVEATAALGSLLEPLHLPAAARWMRGASIHVTLVFIGPTRPDTVPDLEAALRETAAHHQPFQISLGAAGSFGGGDRPRVAWIGLAEGVEPLRRIAEELHPRIFGTAGRLPRPLKPHLTVARRAEDDLVERIDRTLATASPVTWTADRIVLYRSHLGVGPPLHEEFAVARLGDDDTVPDRAG